MKANELRIGNWVEKTYKFGDGTILDKVLKGKPVIKNEPMFSFDFTCFEMEPNLYKPIPLTEDILLKCGFYGNNEEMYLGWFNVEFKKSNWYFVCNDGSVNPKLEYVHQIQNLYFALTGDELEIIL